MPSANAEHPSFVCHDGSTELWDTESVVQADFVGDILFNVEKVDRLGAPLEVVHELVR